MKQQFNLLKLFFILSVLHGTISPVYSCDKPCTPVLINETSLDACSGGNSMESRIRITNLCDIDYFQYESSEGNAVADVDYEYENGSYYAIVTWNYQYVGTTTIKIRGVHDCLLSNKTGDWSNELTYNVTCDPDMKNLTISGASNVCPGSSGPYSIPVQTRATSYDWYFTDNSGNEVNAGSSNGNTNSETVSFNTNLSSNVWMRVRAVNRCGSSYVAKLQIIPKPLVGTPSTPTASSSACVLTNTAFSTNSVTYATSYEWNLSNTSAGNFIPSNVTTTPNVTVDWIDGYTGGTVLCKVRAINDCGNGNWSATKSVIVTGIPGTCGTPTGSSSVCKAAQDVSFSTSGATNATSYDWEISPSSAGTINGVSTSASVDFSPSFSGSAAIRVRGISCTTGVWSNNFDIFVCPSLTQPQTPNGLTEICQDNPNNTYTTSTVENATSYEWELLPVEAGTTSISGTTLTVNWGSDFYGIATIRVRAVNSCETGPWSNALSITVSPYPENAPTPVGETNICQGTVSNNYSLPSPVNYADTYQWELLPASAGTISGSGTIISVMWNSTYSGTATLRVRGVNTCGNGTWSSLLQIIINPLPSKPSTPVGLTSVCEGSVNVQYTTLGASFANNYEWVLLPAEAGYLVPNGITCSINFSGSYTGEASLKVRGISCGYGPFSDEVIISVVKVLDQPSMPTGEESLCQNAGNTPYSASIQVDATSYEWMILPTNAGNIIEKESPSEIEVNWSSTFTGSAELYVRSYNFCGYSSWSDPLNIDIAELPSAAILPSGPYQVCSGKEVSLHCDYIPFSDSYEWNITPLVYQFVTDSSLNDIIIKVNDSYTGLIYYGVMGINSCGQGPESDRNYFTVFESPDQPEFNLEESYCYGSAIELTVVNNGMGYLTNWYNNGEIYQTGNSILFPSEDYQDNLFVEYVNTSSNCTSDLEKVDLNVLEEVVADFSCPVTEIDVGSSVTFINECSENTVDYLWDFGDGLTSGVESPVHNYYNRGSYDVTLVAFDQYSCSDTLMKADYIVVGGGTGIDNLTELGVKLYPVPAGDILNVEMNSLRGNTIQINVYNNLGQVVLSESFHGSSVYPLDISKLEAGVYLIKVMKNGMQGIGKFIKE